MSVDSEMGGYVETGFRGGNKGHRSKERQSWTGNEAVFPGYEGYEGQHGRTAVFGFVTTVECWQMLGYDGKSFQTTRVIVLFGDMGNGKEGWMKDCCVPVDCMNVALSNGGVVPKRLFLESAVV